MQTDQLRWGVIGTGRITNSLVPAIKASSNGELCAIASRDLGRAREWARERDVPLVFGSYDEMLASNDIDAVYISLPNALHKEWSIRAAERGKHVLCEKPVAANAAEAREMIAAAEAHGVKVMEAFMYRFHPQIERLLQLLADGVVGEIKVVRATFGFYLSRPEDVRWVKDLAGGALMDVGCYCVNVARLVTGAEPVAVTASAVYASTGVDESLAGTLEFPNGVLGTVDCSFRTGLGMHRWMIISGTDGYITLDRPFRTDGEAATIHISKLDGSETLRVGPANEYQLMVEHFADAVLHERPLSYPLLNSLKSMAVIDALKESARTGSRVAVRPPHD